MSTHMTRSQAKRNTLLAQGGAAVLLLVAGAAAFVGLPEVEESSTGTLSLEQVLAERAAEKARVEDLKVVEEEDERQVVASLDEVASRLAILHDVEKPAGATVTEEPIEVPAFVSGDPEKAEIKFLGHIAEPGRQVALVSVNGVQRFVAAGAEGRFPLDGSDPVVLRVVSVSAERLEIEREGARETFEKWARTAPAVTRIEGTAPIGGVSPEEAAAMQQSADIDRRRQEAMERRQRMLDERARERGESGEAIEVRPERRN